MRPQDFSEFLGQEELLKPLQLMIRATKERKEPLEHLLLSGLPGLGKTSLALALTQELGVPLKLTSGPALERAKDLVGILSQLEPYSLLFIDEIHRLPRVVEEYLYSAMERFQLEFTLDQGAHARLLKMDIQPFTLVGATTREALLTSAFRSRFGHTLRFEPYTTSALLQILIRNSALLGLKAPTDALQLLAERARGVPRIANRLLRRARDVAQCDSKKELTSEIVHRTLDMLGIDACGLEKIDRRILTALAEAGGRPIGLKALAVAVDEAEDTLEDVLEPWLIRQGLLLRTPQGRILTQKGEALAE
jgi:Holliday junction DNA helicase RuvB